MTIELVVRELHRSERDLAVELDTVAHRHKVEHEVFHVAQDLAEWSRDYLRRLSAAATTFGLDLDAEPRTTARTGAVQAKVSEMLGDRAEPALLLLIDLRRLHRMAAGVSLDWEVLAQGAQALKRPDLLEIASRCQPDTLRQLRWANHMVKIVAPQTMAS